MILQRRLDSLQDLINSIMKVKEKVKVKLRSSVQLFATPWTVACQASLSMEFSRQEYWSGLPCPPPGHLPNSGTEAWSPILQADSFQSEPPGKTVHLISLAVFHY